MKFLHNSDFIVGLDDLVFVERYVGRENFVDDQGRLYNKPVFGLALYYKFRKEDLKVTFYSEEQRNDLFDILLRRLCY